MSQQQEQRYTFPQLHGRVLLAEDTVQLQRLETMLLQKYGLEVEVANNGAEAVEKGRSGTFGLILMEMQMPVMGGVEATHQLRAGGCTTPIVALSANVMAEHRQQFQQAGCDGFLTKPIQRNLLTAELQRYFDPTDGRNENRERGAIVEGAVEEDEAEMDMRDLLSDEMWQEFWDYLVSVRAELQQAQRGAQWQQLRELAHVVKGIGSNFGQHRLSRLAAALQQSASAGVEAEIERDYHALLQWLEQNGPGD